MSKQIYIDSNGNEVLVSGTIINDNNLPHYTGTPTAGTTADAIASLITTETQSTTATIAGNSNATIDIDCTKTGYTLIGVCGYSCYNNDMNVGRINVRGGSYPNTIRLDVANLNSSARTNIPISVTALYIKTFT